jgi:hypothetical protein
VAITAYHIQNVLRNYHRKLRVRSVEDPGDSRGGGEWVAGIRGNTRQEIERQVSSQIRRCLIRRTFQD